MDQIGAERETVAIQGNARNIAPGDLFSLSKYPVGEYNKRYLIESAHASFRFPGREQELFHASPVARTSVEAEMCRYPCPEGAVLSWERPGGKKAPTRPRFAGFAAPPGGRFCRGNGPAAKKPRAERLRGLGRSAVALRR
jgi:uncharacterized protein involved in type VI secretion and phage assembly